MKRLLYFLSKTDEELIAQCDLRSQKQQLAKGILVFISSINTTVIAIYTLFLILKSIPIALIAGLIFGLLNLFFVREVVSAASKVAALIFLPVAIFSAFILSVPFELAVFEKSINKEIVKVETTDIDKHIESLRREIYAYEAELAKLQKQLIDESEGTGGSKVSGRGPTYEQKLKIYQDYKDRREQKINELSFEIDRLGKEKASLLANPSGDFLLRVETLRAIRSSSLTASWVSWAIILLLFMTESFPVLIRLLEYNNAYTELSKTLYTYKKREQSTTPSINVRLAIPTFGRGFASAIDWTGTLDPSSEELREDATSPDEADVMALGGDWKTVGNDLRKVLGKHGTTSPRQAA
jgi:hypothetical protein